MVGGVVGGVTAGREEKPSDKNDKTKCADAEDGEVFEFGVFKTFFGNGKDEKAKNGVDVFAKGEGEAEEEQEEVVFFSEFGFEGVNGIEDEGGKGETEGGNEPVGRKGSHGLHGEREEGDKKEKFFEKRDVFDAEIKNGDTSDKIT